MSNKPYMIMMMGISGSGKSTLAKHISVKDGQIIVDDSINTSGSPVIHSSDDLREELYGDVNNQSNNNELFIELHRRIKNDLRSGKDVIYDATNINKKQRMSFINELSNIACKKVCVAVMTPYENCLRNNEKRERKVPERVIRRMLFNWQPPHFHEGFDSIYFSFLRDGAEQKHYLLIDLFKTMKDFDQENEHHKYTLGEHCSMAYNYCINTSPEDTNLQFAAALHDIGKLETKVRVNRNGINDGNCHYYQHHCVGAYLASFYLAECNVRIDELVDILNLIYFHMHPYTAWKQSEKARERDKKLIGEEMYNEIMILHDADISAH